MKTNYPQNRTSGRGTFLKKVVIVIVVGALLYVAGKPLLSFVSRVSVGTGSVVSRAAEHTGSFFSLVGTYFSSRNTLEEEVQTLSDELSVARLAVIREEALKKENDELRALLSREPKDMRGILAEVILRPPSSPYDTLILNAGEDAGISVGDTVNAEGFIIGEITRTDTAFSVLTLWSQSGKPFDVSIEGKFSGRAEGYGSGSFYIRAPRDTAIAEGDIVIAPEVGNLILGTVSAISRDEKNPFADIYVQSPLSLRTIKFVEIIKK